MRIPPKNILELTSSESMDFLLKSEQYHSFELPEYFDFEANPTLLRIERLIKSQQFIRKIFTDELF